MRIINKKNVLGVIGVSYTILSLFIIVSEVFNNGMSATHFNLILCFVYTALVIGILSTHHLLERLSPLVMIILQYVVAISIVTLITYVTGHFIELHPDAYRDSTRGFTITYIIGAVYYYVKLLIEIRKQNKSLEIIQKVINEKESV